jgi:hypothetical protein
MQMIAERERGGTMDEAMGHLALATSEQSGFAKNFHDYMARKRQQEQDLLGMRVSAAQLASEEARLRQAAANKKAFLDQVAAASGAQLQPQMQTTVSPAQRQMPDVPEWDRQSVSFPAQFDPNRPMQGAPGALPGGAPQAGGSLPYRPGALNANQAMMIGSLFDQDPKEASKQFLTLTNPSETERTAMAAGLSPNTPEWDAHMRMKLAGSGAYVPHTVLTPRGEKQATPLQSAMGSRAPMPAAPMPAAPMPAAPTSQPAAAAPQPMVAAPSAASQPAGPAPVDTGFDPGTLQDLKLRQREFELQQDIRKNEAVQQTEKLDIPERVALKDAVAAAPSNLVLSGALMKDITNNPELFGKLMRPDMFSAFANLVASGVQFGQLGAVNIPAVGNFIQQLSPEAKKDPTKLEAWNRVLGNMAKVNLNFARIAYQGQGAVSNFERELVGTAVGDPSRDSAKNLAIKAKVIEIEARNAMEQNKLWEQSKKNMVWSQFKESPRYKDLQRAQFYRTAKVLKLDGAKWPGDE